VAQAEQAAAQTGVLRAMVTNRQRLMLSSTTGGSGNGDR
jgi:hypothetical protein